MALISCSPQETVCFRKMILLFMRISNCLAWESLEPDNEENSKFIPHHCFFVFKIALLLLQLCFSLELIIDIRISRPYENVVYFLLCLPLFD